MEFEFSRKRIVFRRALSDLDNFVLKFVRFLDRHSIKYVIVSGYVAILFGRSRATEDVDMIAEKVGPKKWGEFWEDVSREFECINTHEAETAYRDYLLQGIALRFCGKGRPLPNIEFKLPKSEYDAYSLKNNLRVELGGGELVISELELQIAYKFFLGSEKDIEDAVHLLRVFEGRLDQKKLGRYLARFKIPKTLKYFGA